MKPETKLEDFSGASPGTLLPRPEETSCVRERNPTGGPIGALAPPQGMARGWEQGLYEHLMLAKGQEGARWVADKGRSGGSLCMDLGQTLGF